MKYRPKYWKTGKAKNHPLHCLAPDDCVSQSFEDGADMMLVHILSLLKDKAPGSSIIDILESKEKQNE